MKEIDRGLVSVIIPNFNYSKYIQECIISVVDQSYGHIEIVVVDDGSTDDSLERIEEFGKKVVLVRSQNQGSCAARNLGLLKSSGPLIAYLDADDFWDQKKIELQVDFLKRTGADLVYCEMRSLGGGSESGKRSPSELIDHEWFLRNPASTLFAPSSVLMTRRLAAKVGGWNTSLTGPAEDFDYFRRCAKYGVMKGQNLSLVSHRQHSESLTARSSIRYFEDNLRVTRLMLIEDIAKINFVRRIFIRFKVRANFIKHAMLTRDSALLSKVLLSFFWTT